MQYEKIKELTSRRLELSEKLDMHMQENAAIYEAERNLRREIKSLQAELFPLNAEVQINSLKNLSIDRELTPHEQEKLAFLEAELAARA